MIDVFIAPVRAFMLGFQMSNITLKPSNAAPKKRGGSSNAHTLACDEPLLEPPYPFKSIDQIAHEWLIKTTLKTRSKRGKKQRIMLLWEHGIISAGDVERLFEKYKLGAA